MLQRARKVIKDKSGGDMLQTLLIIVIIGALVVTICNVVAKGFQKSSNKVLDDISNGALDIINDALSPEEQDVSGI